MQNSNVEIKIDQAQKGFFFNLQFFHYLEKNPKHSAPQNS